MLFENLTRFKLAVSEYDFLSFLLCLHTNFHSSHGIIQCWGTVSNAFALGHMPWCSNCSSFSKRKKYHIISYHKYIYIYIYIYIKSWKTFDDYISMIIFSQKHIVLTKPLWGMQNILLWQMFFKNTFEHYL